MSVETVLRDLEAKRVTLERMEREAHQHDGTLERLSQELMASRQAVAQVQEDNATLQRQLDDMAAQTMLGPKQLFMVDRDTLLTRHVTLLQKHKLMSERNRQMLQRVQYLQNELIKRNELDMQALRLQQAHAAQQAFKENLEAKFKSSRTAKVTVKRQEKAIRLLEQMVRENARAAHSGAPTYDALGDNLFQRDMVESPAYTLLRQETEALVRSVEKYRCEAEAPADVTITLDNKALQEKIDLEEEHVRRLRAQLRQQSSVERKDDSSLAEGESAAIEAERRAQDLEDELLAMSRKQATELADLQGRIWDTQAQAMFAAPASAHLRLSKGELPPVTPPGSRKSSAVPSNIWMP